MMTDWNGCGKSAARWQKNSTTTRRRQASTIAKWRAVRASNFTSAKIISRPPNEHGFGRFLGEAAAPCGKTTIKGDYAGTVSDQFPEPAHSIKVRSEEHTSELQS